MYLEIPEREYTSLLLAILYVFSLLYNSSLIIYIYRNIGMESIDPTLLDLHCCK